MEYKQYACETCNTQLGRSGKAIRAHRLTSHPQQWFLAGGAVFKRTAEDAARWKPEYGTGPIPGTAIPVSAAAMPTEPVAPKAPAPVAAQQPEPVAPIVEENAPGVEPEDLKKAAAFVALATDGRVDLLKMIEDIRQRARVPSMKTQAGFIKPSWYDKAAQILNAGFNLYLTGPAGCGKSEAARQLASSLGLPYFLSAGAESKRDFFGYTRARNGETYFVPGKATAAATDGGLLHIDEADSLDPGIALALNPILNPLQDNKHIDLPEHPDGGIQVSDKFRAIACGNTNGRALSRNYAGTQVQNGAFMSRFVILPVDYERAIEEKLLHRYGLNGTTDKLLDKAYKIRASIKSNMMSIDLATRDLMAMAKLIAAGVFTHEESWQVFGARLSQDERTKLGV